MPYTSKSILNGLASANGEQFADGLGLTIAELTLLGRPGAANLQRLLNQAAIDACQTQLGVRDSVLAACVDAGADPFARNNGLLRIAAINGRAPLLAHIHGSTPLPASVYNNLLLAACSMVGGTPALQWLLATFQVDPVTRVELVACAVRSNNLAALPLLLSGQKVRGALSLAHERDGIGCAELLLKMGAIESAEMERVLSNATRSEQRAWIVLLTRHLSREQQPVSTVPLRKSS